MPTPTAVRNPALGLAVFCDTPQTYNCFMFTVAITQRFESDAAALWSEAEVDQLVAFFATHPHQGDLIPGTGGLRKLRWARPGMGRRGGARVITYAIDQHGKVWLLTAYAKAALDNLSAAALVKLRKELIHV